MKKFKTVKKVIIVWTLITIILTVTDGSFLSRRLLAQTDFRNSTFNNNPQKNNRSDGNRRGLHNNNGHAGSVYIRRPRNPWASHSSRYTKSGRMVNVQELG
ncbi:MAG: hypothetical protein PUP93_32495 [Rhizonema sp. NSF051]|nr:hypothetical protein [Rhizonema sp. NSF051]